MGKFKIFDKRLEIFYSILFKNQIFMKTLTLQEQLEEIGKKFYADSLIGRPNKKHFSENMS